MVLLNMFRIFSKPITFFSKRAIFKVQFKVLEFEPVSGWRRYMASLQCAVAPLKHCIVINFVLKFLSTIYHSILLHRY